MCKGLKDNQLQDTIPSTVENQHLADDLNEFYSRFEKTPHACSGHLSTHPLNTSSNPLSPTPCNSDQQRWGEPGLPEAEKEKIARPRQLHQSVWTPVLTSWPPSSQRSSTDNWNCVKSSHASNAPPSSPSKITGLNEYRPLALMSVVIEPWTSARPLTPSFQTASCPN